MIAVPIEKQIRVIIDTDAKNEADDAFAVVQALLTPKLQIKGIIGAHYGDPENCDSMLKSYEECLKILSIMNMKNDIKVYKGSKKAVTADNKYEFSEGAELIVKEAMNKSALPLFVIFLGPLTDLACAYLEHPEICKRLTAIWIGGGKYPDGGREFNLGNDIMAANIIFHSDISLWQVPVNVYAKMRVSLSELERKVAPFGKIGQYLFNEVIKLNNFLGTNSCWPAGENWCLGDSPAVGLLLEPMEIYADMIEAPDIDDKMHYHFSGNGRKIRVYNDIDNRFIFEDFYAKLAIYTGSAVNIVD